MIIKIERRFLAKNAKVTKKGYYIIIKKEK